MRYLIALICSLCLSLQGHAAELTVSAASSLTNALREIVPLFEAAHPEVRVQLNSAASGVLLQQMVHGAPVDVFASADQATMDLAQKDGLINSESRKNFVSNQLVLVVPADHPQPPRNIVDLTQATYQRIALGVPASVPVGRYTKEALQAVMLWSVLQSKFIQAQSARQVLDYVVRSEVDAGFVYATDAVLVRDKVRVAFTVPTHTPILYPIATVASSARAELADAFVQFLNAEQAQAIFAKYGFDKP